MHFDYGPSDNNPLPLWVGVLMACEGGWGNPIQFCALPGSARWLARRNFFMPKYQEWLNNGR